MFFLAFLKVQDSTNLSGACAEPGVSSMTQAIAFDTHRFVKRLTGSGFTEEQAETLAEEHVSLLIDNLATKVVIERAATEIYKVTVRLEAVKADLPKWLFGAMILQGGLIVALVKLL